MATTLSEAWERFVAHSPSSSEPLFRALATQPPPADYSAPAELDPSTSWKLDCLCGVLHGMLHHAADFELALLHAPRSSIPASLQTRMTHAYVDHLATIQRVLDKGMQLAGVKMDLDQPPGGNKAPSWLWAVAGRLFLLRSSSDTSSSSSSSSSLVDSAALLLDRAFLSPPPIHPPILLPTWQLWRAEATTRRVLLSMASIPSPPSSSSPSPPPSSSSSPPVPLPSWYDRTATLRDYQGAALFPGPHQSRAFFLLAEHLHLVDHDTKRASTCLERAVQAFQGEEARRRGEGGAKEGAAIASIVPSSSSSSGKMSLPPPSLSLRALALRRLAALRAASNDHRGAIAALWALLQGDDATDDVALWEAMGASYWSLRLALPALKALRRAQDIARKRHYHRFGAKQEGEEKKEHEEAETEEEKEEGEALALYGQVMAGEVALSMGTLHEAREHFNAALTILLRRETRPERDGMTKQGEGGGGGGGGGHVTSIESALEALALSSSSPPSSSSLLLLLVPVLFGAARVQMADATELLERGAHGAALQAAESALALAQAGDARAAAANRPSATGAKLCGDVCLLAAAIARPVPPTDTFAPFSSPSPSSSSSSSSSPTPYLDELVMRYYAPRIKFAQQAQGYYRLAISRIPSEEKEREKEGEKESTWYLLGDVAQAMLVEGHLRRQCTCSSIPSLPSSSSPPLAPSFADSAVECFARAEEVLLSLVTAVPTEPSFWHLLGTSLPSISISSPLASKDTVVTPREQAAKREYCLSRALQLDPLRAPSWLALGRCYEARGELSAAERCYDEARCHDNLAGENWEAMGQMTTRREVAAAMEKKGGGQGKGQVERGGGSSSSSSSSLLARRNRLDMAQIASSLRYAGFLAHAWLAIDTLHVFSLCKEEMQTNGEEKGALKQEQHGQAPAPPLPSEQGNVGREMERDMETTKALLACLSSSMPLAATHLSPGEIRVAFVAAGRAVSLQPLSPLARFAWGLWLDAHEQTEAAMAQYDAALALLSERGTREQGDMMTAVAAEGILLEWAREGAAAEAAEETRAAVARGEAAEHGALTREQVLVLQRGVVRAREACLARVRGGSRGEEGRGEGNGGNVFAAVAVASPPPVPSLGEGREGISRALLKAPHCRPLWTLLANLPG